MPVDFSGSRAWGYIPNGTNKNYAKFQLHVLAKLDSTVVHRYYTSYFQPQVGPTPWSQRSFSLQPNVPDTITTHTLVDWIRKQRGLQ